MTTLRIETLTIPASKLGAPSPLPDLRPRRHGAREQDETSAPADQRDYLRATRFRGCVPYPVQDAYDRSDEPRDVQVAVLANDRLRATFLPALGGRLWSLVHTPTGRELLYQPQVLHFVNIGLCRAWFCGGVEWNVSVRGHAAYTCSPVFAAEVRADDGSPVLRLYERDRFRGVLFQIDCLLPDGADALFVRPRIVNPHDRTIPMYWWSNIAVGEVAGHRVVVPAETAYHFDYARNIEEIPVPLSGGVDTSYPTNIRFAHDYFYKVPEHRRPWIASLDARGVGLVQASTSRLLGRKLFVWGTGPGGQHWQQHLGGRGTGYVEIQAGLAPTQADYVPMGPRADWSWLEAYACMQADGAIVHGDDWPAAGRHVEDRLNRLVPQPRLEALLAETAELADRAPRKVLFRGSGWAALEDRRRAADGLPPAAPASMPFPDDSLTDEQAPWLALLDAGALPARPPDEAPGAWMTGAPWARRLAASAAGAGDHWLTWLHLGVAAFADGDLDAAREVWQTSLARQPSAWACRNLAVLAARDRPAEAANLYLRATELLPALLPLQLECGRALVHAGRLDDFDRWLADLPDEVRSLGRVQLCAAQAALARGRLDEAEETLLRVDLPDVREGETTLTDLWYEIEARRIAAAEGIPVDEALLLRVRHTRRPPAHLDYQMS